MNGPVASLNTAWFALIGLLWTGYFGPGSGEFEAELASVPPGDGGVSGEVGVAEDG